MDDIKSALATLKASDVLIKTTRGETEFDRRVRSLPQKVRGVLILVNGQRSVGEIETMLPILPVFGTLAALVATGYVEDRAAAEQAVRAVSKAVAVAAAANAVIAAAARGEPTLAQPSTIGANTISANTIGALSVTSRNAVSPQLEELREAAVAQLRGLAGDAAANMVQRVRACRRIGELRIELQRAAQVLERFVGPTVAKLFDEEMSQRLRALSEQTAA